MKNSDCQDLCSDHFPPKNLLDSLDLIPCCQKPKSLFSRLTGVISRLVVVSVLASVLVGCGIGHDSNPIAISLDQAPELGPKPEKEDIDEDDLSNWQIYMVGEDNRLTTVARTFSREAIIGSSGPNAVLNELLIGATPQERENGINSALLGRVSFRQVQVDDDTRIAYVDLEPGSLDSVIANEQKLAFAQMVYSLTELPGVTSVVFLIGGKFVPVLVDTGNGTAEPGQALRKFDFSSLGRPRVSFADPSGNQKPETTSPSEPLSSFNRPETIEFPLYFMDIGGRLQPYTRNLERDPIAILSALFSGPLASEQQKGAFTSLPNSTLDEGAVSVTINPETGVASIALPEGALPALSGLRKYRSIAQLVYTITALSEIRGVALSVGGLAEAIPTDNGITAAGAVVTREDFYIIRPTTAFGQDALVSIPEVLPTETPLPTPSVSPSETTQTAVPEASGPATDSETTESETTDSEASGSDPEATLTTVPNNEPAATVTAESEAQGAELTPSPAAATTATPSGTDPTSNGGPTVEATPELTQTPAAEPTASTEINSG